MSEPQIVNPERPPVVRRKWRRRFLWLLALVAIARLALAYGAAPALRLAAGYVNLECDVDSIEFDVLSGEARIYGLRMWHGEADEASPILKLEYAGVDLAVTQLFRGNLIVRRIEADGLDMHVARDEFARWNIAPILQPFLAEKATTATEDLAESQTKHTGPLEFDLPFTIEALRCTHLRLHLDDAMADPPLDATITAALRLSDLGDPDRTTHFSFVAGGPQVLDLIEVKADATVKGPEIDSSIELRMRGLYPRPLSGYLELIGLAPVAHRLDADAHIRLDAMANAVGGNHFKLTIDETHWMVDGTESLALDHWTSAFNMEPGPQLRIEPVVVQGARAGAVRDEQGRFSAAGFAFIGAPPKDEPVADAQPVEDEPAADDQVAEAEPRVALKLIDLLPFMIRLDGITVTDCALTFADRLKAPTDPFALQLDEFQFAAIDPEAPEEMTKWHTRLKVPGVFGQVNVQGQCSPFAVSPEFAAQIDSEGADLAKLQTYLDDLGLDSAWKDGRCSAKLHAQATALDTGNWSLDFGVTEMRLGEADAEEPWFAVADAGLTGLVIDNVERRVILTDGHVRGLQSSVQRLADGAVGALGIRTRVESADIVIHDSGVPTEQTAEASKPADAKSTAASPDTPDATSTPWRIEVGKLSLEDTDLHFSDAAITPAVDFRFDALGASLEDFTIGGSTGTSAAHARVRAFLREPGLADSLELSGELTSHPGVIGLDWDLVLTGEGLAPLALKPYLDRAQIEVVDTTSAAHVAFRGSVAVVNDVIDLSFNASECSLGPVDAPFLSASELSIDPVRISSDLVKVGELKVSDPVVRIGRDKHGALLVAGLRIGGTDQAPPTPAADAGTDDSTETPEVPEVDESTATAKAAAPKLEVVVTDDAPQDPFAALDALTMQFELDHFVLEGAQVIWQDQAVEPTLDTAIMIRSTIDGLALRPGAAGAKITALVHLGGETKSIQVDGNVTLDPRAIVVDAELVGDHLDFARLSVYFPPTVSSEATDTQFKAKLHTELVAAEAGGRSFTLEVSDVLLKDAQSEDPALSMTGARFFAPRIDGTNRVFNVAELSNSGLELRVHRDLESRFHLLGLVIDPSATSPSTDPTESSDTAPGTEVRTVSRQPVAVDTDLPTIQLGALSLGIDRLIITDEFQAKGSEPLVIELRATTPESQQLMSDDPGGLAPYRLRLAAKLSPLIDSLAADITFAPFSPEPSVQGVLSMRGLDGSGFIALLPQFADAIDPSGLKSGEFDGTFEAILEARRRGLTNFEFKRGFGIDLLVSDLAFRAAPDGEVLVGLESLEVNAPRINSARQEVIIERIEFVQPRARLARDAKGIHALGLVIDPVALQAALDQAQPKNASHVESKLTTQVVEAKAEKAPSTPQGEIRVDEFLVSGIDFQFNDTSYAPPLDLPLTGLSVEVSRFTTRALVEKLPIRFSTYVESGVVEQGEGFESAPFFEEATLNGQITLYPDLEGWVDAGLTQLALRSLRGPAASSGVTIGDGSMDASVRVRLRGANGMSITAKSSFHDLSMSEPSGGPISRYLGISMPLESALFALRDSNGEIELSPPTIKMSSSGVSTAEIARVATTAIAKEISLAVARAPLRMTKGVADAAGSLTGKIPVVGGVTGDIFGGVSSLFGGGPEEPLPEIGSIEFLPGDVNLLESEQAKLKEAIKRLKNDKKRGIVLIHELTTADIARAAELANPSPDDCRELAIGLRQKKAELYRLRDEVTADARARLLTGQAEQAAVSVERLRTIDTELGRTEVALDQTLAMLQPRAERRRDKRARDAAMQIAEARLASIVDALRAAEISKLDERLEVRRPRPRPVDIEGQESAGGRIKLGVR